MNIKQVFKIIETSAVSGLSAGIGVLSVDQAQLTLKTLAAAGVAALVGFLYQVNRQVGVAEGAASPVTQAVEVATKAVEAKVATAAVVAADTPVAPGATVAVPPVETGQ